MVKHTAQAPWWRGGVIYQVYPRSFADSDGDGVGDLAGIRKRLPWLAELGVDALWLSPVHPSPQRDLGYDIADYCDIDRLFGDLAGFDALVEDARGLGIRVILDLVVNHTSDAHPWFVASRAGDSAYQDWYLWAGGPSDKQPNNWVSVFGGSAWTYDEGRRASYLHSFLPSQPDLNWRNPAVEAAVHEVMRFWMRRGVSGFRMDVYNCYLKDAQLRSNPRNWSPLGLFYGYMGQAHIHDRDQPELVDALSRMRTVVQEEATDGLLVGETLGERDYSKAGQYAGERGIHLAFHFALLRAPWKAAALHRAIKAQLDDLGPGGWPTWVLSNHDFPRVSKRVRKAVGPKRCEAQLKVAALLQLGLKGTPFLYYGDEIGLPEVRVPKARLVDPVGKRFWPFHPGRDGCRTPMAWSDAPNAGFSAGEPWLPLHPDWRTRNAAAQEADAGSLVHSYRALLALRRAHPALSLGQMTLAPPHPRVIAWSRTHGDEHLELRCNLSCRAEPLSLPPGAWTVLYSTCRAPGSAAPASLAPDEGLVLTGVPA